MNSLKRWVKDFLSLSHSQVNGFIVLLPLLAIILLSEPLWHWYVSRQPVDYSRSQMLLDSITARWETARQDEGGETIQDTTDSASAGIRYFAFNPNRATERELRTLGFSKAISSRIVHYVQKGGTFKIKQDLLKIYGLDTSLYKRLYAFVDLPEIAEVRTKKSEYPARTFKRSVPAPQFDLNMADTIQLKTIFGIGERLSSRIVNYRRVLGGFVTPDQIREVYGLDSAVVERLLKASFIEEGFQPVRININKADEVTMAAHPYLSKPVATAIVTYRFQHGEFTGLDDLRKIHALDIKTIQKIAPYLTIDD
jgi:DNA uptake protein ComE-like DNA-binding protein